MSIGADRLESISQPSADSQRGATAEAKHRFYRDGVLTVEGRAALATSTNDQVSGALRWLFDELSGASVTLPPKPVDEETQLRGQGRDDGESLSPSYRAAVAYDVDVIGPGADDSPPGERLFEEILSKLPVPCFALNEDGYLLFYNEEAARLWGRRPELGKEQWSGAFRLLTPEGKELPPSLSAVASALRERRSLEGVESTIERPDGTRRLVADHADPLFDATGNCIGVVNVQLDITEQREMQEAAQRREALFRDVADHAPAMMWVTDAEGSCTYLSQTWYEFTGQTEEEGWMSAIHPEDREAGLVPSAAARARREPYRLEYRLLHTSGEYRRVLSIATPHFDSKGEFLGYIGSVLDITAQKQADESARKCRPTASACHRGNRHWHVGLFSSYWRSHLGCSMQRTLRASTGVSRRLRGFPRQTSSG